MQMPMYDIAVARQVQMELNQNFQRIFDDYDVLLCPGVSLAPFPWVQRNPTHVDGQPVENYMAWLALTASLTVVGHPVTALPCGLDHQGTPFGVQVVGPMYQDHRRHRFRHRRHRGHSGSGGCHVTYAPCTSGEAGIPTSSFKTHKAASGEPRRPVQIVRG